MRHRLVIAVDLDGIVADLMERWLHLYNDAQGHSVVYEDLLSWNMHENVPGGKVIYDYLGHPNLFRDLKPHDGAVEGLAQLVADDHEVHIISAHSPQFPQSAADKVAWCAEKLPFISDHFITLSHQKHRFLADVFVDDSPGNQKRHAAHQPGTLRMGIAWPYNEVAASCMYRAPSCRNTKSAWESMVTMIRQRAEEGINAP